MLEETVEHLRYDYKNVNRQNQRLRREMNKLMFDMETLVRKLTVLDADRAADFAQLLRGYNDLSDHWYTVWQYSNHFRTEWNTERMRNEDLTQSIAFYIDQLNAARLYILRYEYAEPAILAFTLYRPRP